jgi:hypothetical protein
VSVPVLLVTSNGVGMGHLTRQLTVALSGAGRLEPTLASLSGALPTVARAVADGRLPAVPGLRLEHLNSRTAPWMPSGRRGGLARTLAWEPYLRDRLVLLAAETGARVVVFDGVVPYRGLLEARRALPGTAFVWMRRGMWRPGVGAAWLAASDAFDLVVEPGDFAGRGDTGPTRERTDARRVAPVSMTDVLAAVDPREARRHLGLDPDRPALLLAPGSGVHTDLTAAADTVLDAVDAADAGWQVVVTSQRIARHAIGRDRDDVTVLRDVYPLAGWMSGFDAAVGAAGYNAVHELLSARVPTLLVPSTGHETDDQDARARVLADDGVALHASPDDLAGVRAGVERLLDAGQRATLRDATAALPAASGGRETADLVLELAEGREAPAWPTSVGRRRWPAPVRAAVDLSEDADGAGERPVEHVLAGAGERYRDARRRVARRLYRG